jgi:hypothetical protein
MSVEFVLTQLFSEIHEKPDKPEKIVIDDGFNPFNYPLNNRRILYKLYPKLLSIYPKLQKTFGMEQLTQTINNDVELLYFEDNMFKTSDFITRIKNDEIAKNELYVIYDDKYNIMKLNKLLKSDYMIRQLTDPKSIKKHCIKHLVYYNTDSDWNINTYIKSGLKTYTELKDSITNIPRGLSILNFMTNENIIKSLQEIDVNVLYDFMFCDNANWIRNELLPIVDHFTNREFDIFTRVNKNCIPQWMIKYIENVFANSDQLSSQMINILQMTRRNAFNLSRLTKFTFETMYQGDNLEILSELLQYGRDVEKITTVPDYMFGFNVQDSHLESKSKIIIYNLIFEILRKNIKTVINTGQIEKYIDMVIRYNRKCDDFNTDKKERVKSWKNYQNLINISKEIIGLMDAAISEKLQFIEAFNIIDYKLNAEIVDCWLNYYNYTPLECPPHCLKECKNLRDDQLTRWIGVLITNDKKVEDFVDISDISTKISYMIFENVCKHIGLHNKRHEIPKLIVDNSVLYNQKSVISLCMRNLNEIIPSNEYKYPAYYVDVLETIINMCSRNGDSRKCLELITKYDAFNIPVENRDYVMEYKDDGKTFMHLWIEYFKEEPPMVLYHSPHISTRSLSLPQIWSRFVGTDVPNEMKDMRAWNYMRKHGVRRPVNITTVYKLFTNSIENKLVFIDGNVYLDAPAVKICDLPIEYKQLKRYLVEELDINDVCLLTTINSEEWNMVAPNTPIYDIVVLSDRITRIRRVPLKKVIEFVTTAIKVEFDIDPLTDE